MHIRIIGVSKSLLRRLIEASLRSIEQQSEHILHMVGWIEDPTMALPYAQQWQADLVILDPALDRGAVLQQWTSMAGSAPNLLCWTTSGRYAASAFSAGAVHYLASDPPLQQVQQAIDRVVDRLGRGRHEHVLREGTPPFRRTTIAMPGYDGIEVRPAGSVVSAHGYDGYTRIHLLDEPPVVLSKSLGEMEAELRAAGLLRVHRSHMVNPALIRRVLRGKAPRVVMITGEHVEVSPRYRDVLYEVLCLNAGKRAI